MKKLNEETVSLVSFWLNGFSGGGVQFLSAAKGAGGGQDSLDIASAITSAANGLTAVLPLVPKKLNIGAAWGDVATKSAVIARSIRSGDPVKPAEVLSLVASITGLLQTAIPPTAMLTPAGFAASVALTTISISLTVAADWLLDSNDPDVIQANEDLVTELNRVKNLGGKAFISNASEFISLYESIPEGTEPDYFSKVESTLSLIEQLPEEADTFDTFNHIMRLYTGTPDIVDNETFLFNLDHLIKTGGLTGITSLIGKTPAEIEEVVRASPGGVLALEKMLPYIVHGNFSGSNSVYSDEYIKAKSVMLAEVLASKSAGGGDYNGFVSGHYFQDFSLKNNSGSFFSHWTSDIDTANGGSGNVDDYAKFVFGSDTSDHIHGGHKDDKLFGGGGDDHINFGNGNDYAEGGEGKDVYYITSGTGVKTISDTDGYIQLDGKKVTGFTYDPSSTDAQDPAKKRLNFSFSGDDLVINNSVIIKNFVDGMLGITFKNSFNFIDYNEISDIELKRKYYGNSTKRNFVDEVGNNNIIGTDYLHKSAVGKDYILGTDKNENIYGLSGSDSIYAGKGNDYIQAHFGDIYINAGEGDDAIMVTTEYSSPSKYQSLLSKHNISNHVVVDGGKGNDVITVTASSFVIDGGAGNDIVHIARHLGDKGEINYTGGIDIYRFDAGRNDSSWGESSSISFNIQGSSSEYTVHFAHSTDSNFGYGHFDPNATNDLLTMDDNIYHDGGAYLLFKNSTTGEGFYLSIKAKGRISLSDYLNTYDNFSFNFKDASLSLSDIAEKIAQDNLYGGKENDLINGDGENNTIKGLHGNDTLHGNEGDDVILGGDGNDTLYGGEGNDTIYGNITHLGVYSHERGNDEIYGGNGNDFIHGGGGNNKLYGGSGNDTIYVGGTGSVGQTSEVAGGQGNDQLYGSSGNEVYIFNIGDGVDVIKDRNGHDSIKFGPGILPENLSIDWQWPKLTIRILDNDGNPTADKIVINGSVEEFRFNDGQVLSWQEIHQLGRVIDGSNSSDFITGQGNSIINGNDGNDTIWAKSSDNVWAGKGDDTINFSGVSMKLYGGDGNDVIQATTENFGFGNGNLIEGGKGNDSIKGTSRDDRYIFSLGDGHDQVITGGGNDIIVFGAGISVDNLKIYSEDSKKFTIVIVDNEGSEVGDKIEIQSSASFNGNSPFSIEFDDGTSLTSNDIKPIKITKGTEAQDSLYGSKQEDIIYGLAGDDDIHSNDGDDTLIGGTGNDRLNGGRGDDKYVFNLGDGADEINDSEGVNILEFGDGITDSSLLFTATERRDIIIHIVDSQGNPTKDSIKVKNMLYNHIDGIGKVLFSDGSSLSEAEILAKVGIGTEKDDILYGSNKADTLNGLAGNDSIYASNGDDMITGGEGNDKIFGDGGKDTIVGGQGNDALIGGAGNDTYIFNLGDGQDVITDKKGFNTLEFGAGISTANLSFIAEKKNLKIVLLDDQGNQVGDQIVVKNMLKSASFAIDQIKFADGSTLSQDEILAQVSKASSVAESAITQRQNEINEAEVAYSLGSEKWLFDTEEQSDFSGYGIEQVQAMPYDKLSGVGTVVITNPKLDKLISAMGSFDAPSHFGGVSPYESQQTEQLVLVENFNNYSK